MKINENNYEELTLDYFLLDNSVTKNSLVEIYVDFIKKQNEFLSNIEKSKIHESYLKNIKKIYIQEAEESDIIKVLDNEKYIEIIINNCYKKYNFDEKQNIKYDEDYKKIYFNYDEIEKKLGENILHGIKRFIEHPFGLRVMKYKDEIYNDINNDILYDFQNKYNQNKLEENEKRNITEFIEKKNKKESYSFLLSLQFLMLDILSKSYYLKNDNDIYDDVITKMPIANFDQSQKEYFYLVNSFFEKKEDNDDDILSQMNDNNNDNVNKYTIDKLFEIYEISKELYPL